MLKQIFQLLQTKIVKPLPTEEISTHIITEPTEKNYSLYSGERQTASEIDGIRMDHLSRYELINQHLNLLSDVHKINGLDVFCGNGYGSFLLAKSHVNTHITGVDGSAEAIAQANKNYSLGNNFFSHKLFPFQLPANAFDFIACFESLEHVEDDSAMFSEIVAATRPGGIIFVSVPNQKHHDLQKNPHIFHFRHYIHSEFLIKFQGALELHCWYGQDVYKFDIEGVNTFELLHSEDMLPRKNVHGQVNIYVFKKTITN
jgi:2-polyprenyl-3-methyl-5-hydroxy-6-metoxy-1,4-benzoquinol methylase